MTKIAGSIVLVLLIAAGVGAQGEPECPALQPDVRVQDPAVWADYFRRNDACERAEAERARKAAHGPGSESAGGEAPAVPASGDGSGALFIDVP